MFYRARFGLFSQPASNAIGDTNVYNVKTAKLDEDGKVITAPRNLYTTGTKKGATDKVLFSKPGYNCLGNPFKEAGMNAMRTLVKDAYTIGGHDKDFKPAKMVREKLYLAPYEYIPLQDGKKKLNGMFNPENFGHDKQFKPNNPIKSGQAGKGTSIGPPIPYIEDDYNILKKIEAKERERNWANIQKIGDGKNWCPRAKKT